MLTVNLGTGQGGSVPNIITVFKKVSGRPVLYQIGPRRTDDSDPALAKQLLDWQAARDLDLMCADVWRWQPHNLAARYFGGAVA